MLKLPTARVQQYYAHNPPAAPLHAPRALVFADGPLLQSVFASLLPYLALEHRLPDQLLATKVAEVLEILRSLDARSDAKQPYFARQVLFEAGIHYYVPNPDPAKAWVRDPTAYFRLTATISAPKLDPDHEWVPNLNDIGEEVIADRSNCSTRFARMVKRVQKEGNYKDNDEVKKRLLKTRHHTDHKEDISNFDKDLELLMAALTDTQTIITDRAPTKGKKQRVKAPMGKLEAHDKKE
jgi:hypothetical protein